MAIEVTLEDYVAPAKPDSEYKPLVLSLIKAGPDKVAVAVVATEAEAKAFVADVQEAARREGKSGRNRGIVKTDKGYKVSVSVTERITRNRTAK